MTHVYLFRINGNIESVHTTELRANQAMTKYMEANPSASWIPSPTQKNAFDGGFADKVAVTKEELKYF